MDRKRWDRMEWRGIRFETELATSAKNSFFFARHSYFFKLSCKFDRKLVTINWDFTCKNKKNQQGTFGFLTK